MAAHWTLNDLPWDRFDPSKVDPELLRAVKAAALVEHNADDYVTYLCNVFADDPAFCAVVRQWGVEEVQHGQALARWAQVADPDFDPALALKRFTENYRLPLEATASVRGSRNGELVARCVVECGTSSFYSAIRDATDEPLLKLIAAKIAADEFRHFKLFYDHLQRYSGMRLARAMANSPSAPPPRQKARKVKTGISFSASFIIGQLMPQNRVSSASRIRA